RTKRKLPKSVVNNAQVTDHHAIIPTEQPVVLEELNQKEQRIYDLVVKRFLAVLSQPYEFVETKITANIDRETFTAKGKVTQQLGWKEVYDGKNGEDDDRYRKQFSNLKEGIRLNDVTLRQTSGETAPPERFTEGELLQAMENPSRFMHSSVRGLERMIHQRGCLGTVRIWTYIIEKVFDKAYIEKKGTYLHMTSKGTPLLYLVPKD